MRRKLARLLIVAAGAPLLVCASVVLWLCARYGQFEPIRPDSGRVCARIPGIVRGEDLAVDAQMRRAFVSASNGLFRIDLARDMTVTNITPRDLSFDLNPHGLSLHATPEGSRTLFVVNHARAHEAAVIFDVSAAGELTFLEEIKSRELIDLNDIAAVDRRKFYATNSYTDSFGKRRFSSTMNALIALSGWHRTGNVVYFDGSDVRAVAARLAHPNGINSSKDGRRIYVAESTAKRILGFERDPETGGLTLQTRTNVPGAPDNIDVAADGTLYVAALPRMLELAAHVTWSVPAVVPSRVISIAHIDTLPVVKKRWTDDGNRLSALTVAVPFSSSARVSGLLLGSGGDDHLLACFASSATTR